MIWFGDLSKIVRPAAPAAPPEVAHTPVYARMQAALERVAERAPHLGGTALLDALAATGWVDRETAQRLLPAFPHFDPDRHFAEHLRRLSFRGRSAEEEFRGGVRRIVEDLTGSAEVEEIGAEPAIRFRNGEHEGVVLAHPEVAFSIGGSTRAAIAAAVEEMPDALVVVARNFDRGTADQLSAMLQRTGVPGTLITVNLLLGMRAITQRYQPGAERVVKLLGAGRELRSRDIAVLGDR
jgi:hypothetical protein